MINPLDLIHRQYRHVVLKIDNDIAIVKTHYQVYVVDISIHASRAGCDLTMNLLQSKENYFNPRIPCGMRPGLLCLPEMKKIFQSTHPVRDATTVRLLNMRLALFQSTHPVRDATQNDKQIYINKGNFNPRIPCGMRQSCPYP